CARDFRGYW
nr:immunoglobulin heavy chain junction region [Homo sapiens]